MTTKAQIVFVPEADEKLSVWERIGRQIESTPQSIPIMSAEVLATLRLVEAALANSTPNHPHYPEPHSKHDQALAAVRKLLPK